MGCTASKPKKSEAPLRKRSTLNKNSMKNEKGKAPTAPAVSINEADKSYSEGVMAAKQRIAKDQTNAEFQGKSANKQSADATDTSKTEPAKEKKSSKAKQAPKQEDISVIVAEFKDMKDAKIVGDMPQSILLFNKHRYSTKYWTSILFSIHNKAIKAVRYFVEHKKVNRRLSTINRQIKPDQTEYEREILPLLLAMSNEDEVMFEYLWSMNELWGIEHLKLVLSNLFSHTSWAKGIEILLDSEATQDIYNGLSYTEKKQFMIEINYRYLAQATDEIKKTIRKMMLHTPYALVTLQFLMAEMNKDNTPFIKKCLHIPASDYAKMKYEANKEYLEEWSKTLEKFQSLNGDFTKIAKEVTSMFLIIILFKTNA